MMKTLVLILVAVVCAGCGNRTERALLIQLNMERDFHGKTTHLYLNCKERCDRLAADSADLTKSNWFITACGDTIWTTGQLQGGADSVHCADDEKWLQAVNRRLIRLAADSARRVR